MSAFKAARRRPVVVRAAFIEPSRPTATPRPPSGPGWIHEIKHDGYRLMVRKNATGVRLLTRNGNNWTDRYPAIAAAGAALRAKSFLIDGEVVVCGPDGLASFDELRHGPRVKPMAVLYAFDLIELNGEDLRREPIQTRKGALERLVRFSKNETGIRFVDHIEIVDAELVFANACELGCEGIVSKRLGSPYVSGRSRDWLKAKNPAAPAVKREAEEDWSK